MRWLARADVVRATIQLYATAATGTTRIYTKVASQRLAEAHRRAFSG